ncbi:hypothetical protein GCM10009839_02610 [Catenulispora yoronensis]|uniref:Thioredoxin domain-containing protein n=1 Tax=Catenulispora yoronensis TaxID=450799 RepID=A0ABN2TJW8_9ACTN
MTSLAWTAIIAANFLAAASLLLTISLHRKMAAAPAAAPRVLAPHEDPRLPQPGLPLPLFEVTAGDGSKVDSGDLEGLTVLSFFASGCNACGDQITLLTNTFADAPGWARWISVVDGPTSELRAEHVSRLTQVSQVVEGPEADKIQSLMDIDSWPLLVLVENGVVVGAGRSVSMLEFVVGRSLANR